MEKYNSHKNIKWVATTNLYPQVVTLDNLTSYDKDHTKVVTDKILIDKEITRLQAEYDALAWKRSREAEFPSIQDLVVALYDTDDKSAVEAKRASVKAKYPKP